jgi:hypothetical protein
VRPYVTARHYHLDWEGVLAVVALMSSLIVGSCGTSRTAESPGILQLRVVVASRTATCPSSIANPAPSRAVTLRDPYDGRCDQLGSAGLVIGLAPAVARGNDPPMVRISLTPSQGKAYTSFMTHNQGASIATVALGAIQSAAPTLDLFSGELTFFDVTARDPLAARQLARALSGPPIAHRQVVGVLQLRPVVRSNRGTCPASVQDPSPSSMVTVRDPDGECDLLGPAGLVISHAPALVSAGSPPTVVVDLTSKNGTTYLRFLSLHQGARIAFYALGMIQWATHMTSFFKTSQTVLTMLVRNASAARQLVRALSG